MSTATAEPTEATTMTEATSEGIVDVTKPIKTRAASTAIRLIGTRYESFVNVDRFQPGYDAKAKSQMIKDALQTEDEALAADAVAALTSMNWLGFLDTKRRTVATRGLSEAERAERAKARAEKNEAAKAARAATRAKSNEELNAELNTPAAEEGLYVRKGKSGWFVMQGEKGIRKFNTEDEAQAYIREHNTTETTTETPNEAQG